MLTRVGQESQTPCVPIRDARFPSPFDAGLEFSAPARGGWTIVHVGMLVPEAHEIFVCAAGCLRGVVLSAAEMGLTGRFSTVAIEEHNVTDGDMEDLVIDGVTDILNRLPSLPKAVLVYSSCVHHFMGCDLELCYRTLRERFPGVDFTDCYMIPTMRKSGLTPDQIMRRQLYSLLKPVESAEKHCAVLGNCFSPDESSDLARLIRGAGWTLHQITECRTYAEYQRIAACPLFISTQPVAKHGAEALANRLGRAHLYLPACWGADEIRRNLAALADALGTACPDTSVSEAESEAALAQARAVIGSTLIAIDSMFTPRPLGLARLLLERGFNVADLFADAFGAEEREDFLWLQEHAPTLTVHPTVHTAMRRFSPDHRERTLALGQKAAWFMDTPHFVNLVENGGLYGFDGIAKLAALMTEAFLHEKDMQRLIGIKGLGCESCL